MLQNRSAFLSAVFVGEKTKPDPIPRILAVSQFFSRKISVRETKFLQRCNTLCRVFLRGVGADLYGEQAFCKTGGRCFRFRQCRRTASGSRVTRGRGLIEQGPDFRILEDVFRVVGGSRLLQTAADAFRIFYMLRDELQGGVGFFLSSAATVFAGVGASGAAA